MKVFISADIEGVACVVSVEDGKLQGVEYERAREWMTGEVNAAVEGAFESGATEVVVADSHGHMRNIMAEKLHEDALLVRGSPRPGTMMEGLDESFDAAFLIGYHAMAGTPKGVLAHTYLGSGIYAIRLNGITVGEPGFNTALAGHYNVPVALVSGMIRLKLKCRNLTHRPKMLLQSGHSVLILLKILPQKPPRQRLKLPRKKR